MKTIELSLKDDFKDIEILCDALSSGTRLNLLKKIVEENGELSHQDLAEKLGITSSGITHNLTGLILAELVDEEDGKGLKGRKIKKPKCLIDKIIIKVF